MGGWMERYVEEKEKERKKERIKNEQREEQSRIPVKNENGRTVSHANQSMMYRWLSVPVPLRAVELGDSSFSPE